MAKIYLGGTFYAFTAEEVKERQAEIERQLDPSIEILKPKATADYNDIDSTHCDMVITMRDKYMVRQSDMVVLDLSDATKPPRGALIEIGWANAWEIPILVIIAPDSPDRFCMLNSLTTWQVATREDAARIINTVLT